MMLVNMLNTALETGARQQLWLPPENTGSSGGGSGSGGNGRLADPAVETPDLIADEPLDHDAELRRGVGW